MRSSFILLLSLATAISAHGVNHRGQAKRGVKVDRAWGRRQIAADLVANLTSSNLTSTNTTWDQPTGVPTPTVTLTAVPDVVTGDITISNLEAAPAEQTAAAVGADRGDTAPLPACAALAPFGSYCDPTATDCCQTGTTCISNICQRLCDIDSVEAYCDDEFPCNAALGYVCTSFRCRPPATATHVATGSTCDQGAGNTAFCLPGKATCYQSTCVPCTQHS